jgi:hypothetical protein
MCATLPSFSSSDLLRSSSGNVRNWGLPSHDLHPTKILAEQPQSAVARVEPPIAAPVVTVDREKAPLRIF